MRKRNSIFFVLLIIPLVVIACNGLSVMGTTNPSDSQSNDNNLTLSTSTLSPTVTFTPTPTVDLRKGQISFIINGNVWYKNLETEETRQLTYDANRETDHLHIYSGIRFSPSGRYLVYDYGNIMDGTAIVFITDLPSMEVVSQVAGEMIIGWKNDEDVLIVGHNSDLCGDRDFPTVANDDISFIVSQVDPDSGVIAELVTLPGGFRLPAGLYGPENHMVFMPCPCEAYECYWTREVFTAEGNLISNELEISSGHSSNGRYKVPVFYSIHAPETSPLVVEDLWTGTSTEIFRQEGKYVTGAMWSPADEWIIFWLGDVAERDHSTNMWAIHPDGEGGREITPMPSGILGWFPDGRLIISSSSGDQLFLYDIDSAKVEVFSNLDIGQDYWYLTWHKLY